MKIPTFLADKRTRLIVSGAILLVVAFAIAAVLLLNKCGLEDHARPPLVDLNTSDPDFDAVSAMIGYGLLELEPDGSIQPDQAISRAEFARITCRVLHIWIDRPIEMTFADVLPNHPDYAAVEALSAFFKEEEASAIPIDKPEFRPDDPVLRQTATMIVNQAIKQNPAMSDFSSVLSLPAKDPIFTFAEQPLTRRDAARLFYPLIQIQLPTPAPMFEIRGVR